MAPFYHYCVQYLTPVLYIQLINFALLLFPLQLSILSDFLSDFYSCGIDGVD